MSFIKRNYPPDKKATLGKLLLKNQNHDLHDVIRFLGNYHDRE